MSAQDISDVKPCAKCGEPVRAPIFYPLEDFSALTQGFTQKAARDVLHERSRQIFEEGCTPAHDAEHDKGEIAIAAALYAHPNPPRYQDPRIAPPVGWPWHWTWWKPKDRRRDLVRAAALLLAEIERLDRKAARSE